MAAVPDIIFIGLAVILRLALCYMVLRNKSVQETAFAWILGMLLVPGVTLVFYLIFGVDYRKEKVRRMVHGESQRRFREDIPREMAEQLFRDGDPENVADAYVPLVKLNMANGLGNRLFHGNSLEIITSGKRKEELLLRDLAAARKSIHMEYFRFENDASGTEVRDILVKKAKEGVEVRFLMNNVVARRIPGSFWKPMRDAGVQIVKYTTPRQGLRLFLMRLNCQQHRKIVVIDGSIGYTGGMNISDNYFNLWQDTHVRMEGPAVASLQASFLDTWISCKGAVDKPLRDYFTLVEPAPGGKTVQIITDQADYPLPATQMAYEWVLANAKDYVYFQTPYFVPPTSFLLSLKSAAMRGVDVRVMLSRDVDAPALGPLNRAYYTECLQAGVKIIESDGSFNHSKTMVADDYLSVIGATNLDMRSFITNNEVNTFIYDKEAALAVKKTFMDRLSGAKEWTLDSWLDSRKFRSDMWSRILRLLYREF